MGIIIPLKKLSSLSQSLKKGRKAIVLAGGCFDILHPGHVIFLEKAKKAGDILIVLLESDQKIRNLKGDKRPVHNQIERAIVLKALQSVDYIIPISFIETERDYDQLISRIKPDIIAATYKDSNAKHHLRVAKLIGAKLKYVTKMIGKHSTTAILNR